MGTIPDTEPRADDQDRQAPSSAILIDFVRLLARHTAREAFASTPSAASSDSHDPNSEDSREAKV